MPALLPGVYRIRYGFPYPPIVHADYYAVNDGNSVIIGLEVSSSNPPLWEINYATGSILGFPIYTIRPYSPPITNQPPSDKNRGWSYKSNDVGNQIVMGTPSSFAIQATASGFKTGPLYQINVLYPSENVYHLVGVSAFPNLSISSWSQGLTFHNKPGWQFIKSES